MPTPKFNPPNLQSYKGSIYTCISVLLPVFLCSSVCPSHCLQVIIYPVRLFCLLLTNTAAFSIILKHGFVCHTGWFSTFSSFKKQVNELHHFPFKESKLLLISVTCLIPPSLLSCLRLGTPDGRVLMSANQMNFHINFSDQIDLFKVRST